MSYTEDHLVEKPAIQLMQHELGWDVGEENIEPSSPVGYAGTRHRTSNIRLRSPSYAGRVEHRSEEKRQTRTVPARQRLNPDLPVEAIEGAVER